MEPSYIRELRRQLGWTQMDLADAMDVDQGTVSRWERGVDVPRPARVAALRDILVKEDSARAMARFQARFRHALHPATLHDARTRLLSFNAPTARHYRDAYDFDLHGHLGCSFERHAASLSLDHAWQAFCRSELLRGDILLARIYFKSGSSGHVTQYEPFFDGGMLAGFGATLIGRLAFPESTGTSTERIEVITLSDPDRLVDVHHGEWAEHARLV